VVDEMLWGGSEKFSHGMVRSRKPLLTVTPFIADNCYAPIQPCIILADTRWNLTSPDPQLKASTTSHRRTNERERTSGEQIYGPS